MVTVSTSTESYHHGSLREALIEAGIASLEGADGKDVSLRALAREVGVSATAVYRHFPDKQALMVALAQEGLSLLAAQQRAAADKVGGGIEGFTETGRAYVRFALSHPALFRLIFTQGEPLELGDIPDDASALLITKTRSLSSDPKQAEVMALQAWSIAHGIAMLMLDGRIPADDKLIERLLSTKSPFTLHGSRSEESP